MSLEAASGPPEGVDADLQHPQDVIRTVNFVTQALTIAFVSIFVAIRGISKYRVTGLGFTIDDYLTFISWILMVGYCVCGIFLSVYGGGYHIWEVPQGHIKPFFQIMYACTIFYAPMALFVKLSLLTLIARIFAPYKRRVIGIYVLDGLLVMYYVAALIIKIRICWPISAYWTLDATKCLDQAAIITADSIISVITDAIILVLPLPMTWSLQLPTSKKLRVGGMLAVGGLATGFSAWRLHLILTDGKSPDATILFIQVVLSGNAEAGIGLICTCLPATARLIHKVKERTGYGSSGRSNAFRTGDSAGHKLSNLSNSRTTKERYLASMEPTSDESQLVTNAQGQGIMDPETAPASGIMRKVEVTHTITYAPSESSSDESARKPSR